ncbi:MAG TPA: metal-dependent transcriptional regulator [Actinomycetota bacterium]|nr:metal-dependent transcriptional regulator [Actinomycetota bacterium]
MSSSSAVQDYLKAIYQLGGDGSHVSTSDLADRLDVRAPSVSSMVRRLHDQGLARHSRYQGVKLTRAGVRQALEVIRHHRLLELYLVKELGMDWDQVHEEAEVLEHVLSEHLESRLDALLGHPTEDPHGDPIPTADLTVDSSRYPPLVELHDGARCVVRRVSDRDPEMLRHLGALGIRPGAEVTVLSSTPFGGDVRIRVGRRVRQLGARAAECVFVDGLDEEAS